MQCAACERELEAFTGDVCPHCQHFAHPTRLGIYDGLELIKRGGMGSVYRARHPELGTVVAIKTVHTHTGPETLARRFEQEARLAARIPHPGVVRVFDYDCQEGRLYLVMEFVDGETLRPVIEDDKMDLAWRLDKVAQLAEILHTAHEKGIVHRDIKPENVMVDVTGRVRVLDFGISRVLDAGEQLTQTGEILGTPEYIAPEQILDVPEAVDARTDVYAMGVVLYELLTGHSPFAGNNLFQVLKNVESLDPPPPSQLRPGIAAELDTLVMACMAKDRAGRPTDSRAVARRLRGFTPHGVVRSGLPWWFVAMLALICAVLGNVARAWWPAGDTEARLRSALEPSPSARIHAVLNGTPPYDRSALAAACEAIPDAAPADELFWRGMARKHTGALFLALRDFESAWHGGVAPAREQAAILWVYKHKLFPKILGDALLQGPFDLDVEGDDEFAQFIERIANNTPQKRNRSDPINRTLFLDTAVLWNMLTGEPLAVDSATSRERYLPKQMCEMVARGVQVVDLERMLPSIDRTVPMRYFLEAAIAIRSDDESRLRAALELAQVTGEANFATAVYLSHRMRPNHSVAAGERDRLRQMAAELTGPHADAVRRRVQERLK
jgi:predicted Ser/Thr protein kinase